LEVLEGYIRDETTTPAEAKTLLEKLKPHLHLSDEDRLLLRLRYLEGLPLDQAARLLHLTGDPYKRLNKTLKSLRIACERAGLL
jgi:DNA-directed RNA polymerase specialized sigma24 family protein